MHAAHLLGYAVGSKNRGLKVRGVDRRAVIRCRASVHALARAACLCALSLPALSLDARATGAAQVAPPVQVLQLCYERLDILPWRTLNGRGLNLELIRMAAAKVGVAVQFVTLPWKRCLSEMRDGAVHGVFAASFLPERTAFGAYPGGSTADSALQLHSDGFTLVRRKGEAVNWDGKHLTGLMGPVGVQVGYSIVNDLRKLGVPVDEGSQSARELLQKLQLGRIGAAAVGNSDLSMLMGDRTVSDAFDAAVEALPVPLAQKSYYLMLSHQLVQDAPALASQLWQGIAAARSSADYQKLLRDTLSGRRP